MPTVRMLKHTAHADHGALRRGDVIEVSPQLAESWLANGLAEKASARAKAEADAEVQAVPEPTKQEGHFGDVTGRADIAGGNVPETTRTNSRRKR